MEKGYILQAMQCNSHMSVPLHVNLALSKGPEKCHSNNDGGMSLDRD